MGIHADDLYDLALMEECDIWDRQQALSEKSVPELMNLVVLLKDDATAFLKSVHQYYKSNGSITAKQRSVVIRSLARYPESYFEDVMEDI